jgi:hypothetical protein
MGSIGATVSWSPRRDPPLKLDPELELELELELLDFGLPEGLELSSFESLSLRFPSFFPDFLSFLPDDFFSFGVSTRMVTTLREEKRKQRSKTLKPKNPREKRGKNNTQTDGKAPDHPDRRP